MTRGRMIAFRERPIFTSLLIGFVVLLIATACTETGDLTTETQSIAAGDARSIAVNVELGTGKLTLGGGATELLDGEFIYNVADWKPQVDYAVNGAQGRLDVRQASDSNVSIFDLGEVRSEWDLRLGNDLPLDLAVDLGAGQSTLALGDLPLTGLDVQLGAGDVTIDLNGRRIESLNANIEGGAGKLTLRLPKDVGVRVNAETGIGDVDVQGLTREDGVYVNDAYRTAGAQIDIAIEAGAGKIDLEVVE